LTALADGHTRQRGNKRLSKLGLGPVGVALTVSDIYLNEAAELEQLGSATGWSTS
jgi:hypothetical protein